MKPLHGDGAARESSTSSWRVTGAEGNPARISRPAAGDGAHAACAHLTQHLDAVRRFVRVRLRHDVEDVVQQTCVTFLENVHRFRGDSSVQTFLLGIAQNVMHGERRRRSRAELSRELEPDELVSSPSLRGGLGEVAAGLALLPAELRNVLELLYWQNLTQAEAAKKLGLSRGTVASRVRRAKDSLRWHLCEAVPQRQSREWAAVVEQESTVLL
jgi:RNA polymerase sigma-70 factor (ECF subfamily)